MKQKLFYLLIITFLISIQESKAQGDFRNGYIVTLQNDTIHGAIDFSTKTMNYNQCRFKKDGQTKKYFPNELKSYTFINDKSYVSGICENSFVECLIEGKLNLYRKNQIFYLKKDNDKVYQLESYSDVKEINSSTQEVTKNHRWRGTLKYMLSDCEGINLNMSTYRFTEKYFTKIVKEYNEGKGSKQVVRKANKPWNKFNYGVIAGYQRSTIKVKKDFDYFIYMDSEYTANSPFAGLLFELSSPRLSEKVILQPEIHFFKTSFSSLVIEDYLSYRRYFDTYIEFTKLSLPVSIKYNMPRKKYTYFIQAGINYDIILDSETKLTEEKLSAGVVTTYEGEAFEMVNHQFGLFGGVGVSREFKHFNAALACRFHQMTDLNSLEGFSAKNNKISLSLIITRK